MPAKTSASRNPRPLQFGLRSLLAAVALAAALFSMLGWLGVPPEGQLIVLAILGLAVAAAVGLLLTIAERPGDDKHDDDS